MENNATYVPQVGGKHYQSTYQVWDYAADVHLDPYRFNAIKYLQRAGQKPEVSELRDVKAALSYVQKLSLLLRNGNLYDPKSFAYWWLRSTQVLTSAERIQFTDKFADSNKIKPEYFAVIVSLVNLIDADSLLVDLFMRLEDVEKRLEACVAKLQTSYE